MASLLMETSKKVSNCGQALESFRTLPSDWDGNKTWLAAKVVKPVSACSLKLGVLEEIINIIELGPV